MGGQAGQNLNVTISISTFKIGSGRAEEIVSPDCRPPSIITAPNAGKILSEPCEVRKHPITFRVNDMELEAINRRYAETSFRSRGDFCRYSALTVMNVEEDTKDIKQIARYISSISNSFNQVSQSAAHRAFAEFMVMSTPQMELSDRIHKMEKQIPAIEKYHEFVAYHKKYTSLEGKAKTMYKSDFCYELDEYHKAYKKLIELFPDAHIPKLSKLKTEHEKARTDYAEQSAERKALKKEADRLSRLAQQKRDSQRTLARYMQNEQAAKRKKGQLE